MKRWGADVSLFDPNMSFAPASGIGGLSQLNLQRLLDQVVDGARGLRERPLLGPEAAKAAMQDSSWADVCSSSPSLQAIRIEHQVGSVL